MGTANEHYSSLVCINVCVCDVLPSVNDAAAHPNWMKNPQHGFVEHTAQ